MHGRHTTDVRGDSDFFGELSGVRLSEFENPEDFQIAETSDWMIR
jgi:hypothetical protein